MNTTLAERALALYDHRRPLIHYARRVDLGLEIQHPTRGTVVYIFSDGSQLITKGRGRNHHILTIPPTGGLD